MSTSGADGDPPLAPYGRNDHRLVSLIEAFERAIVIASERRLQSVVIFKDDIKFAQTSRSYGARWNARFCSPPGTSSYSTASRPTPANPLSSAHGPRQTLYRIMHNTCAHCVIIKSHAYSRFAGSLAYCAKMGYPADFFYGAITHGGRSIVLATTRNLTGQRGSLVSKLQGDRKRNNLFPSEFMCYRHFPEFAAAQFLRKLRSLIPTLTTLKW